MLHWLVVQYNLYQCGLDLRVSVCVGEGWCGNLLLTIKECVVALMGDCSVLFPSVVVLPSYQQTLCPGAPP